MADGNAGICEFDEKKLNDVPICQIIHMLQEKVLKMKP